MDNTEYNFLKEQVIDDLLHYQEVIDSHSSMPIELPNNVLSRVLFAHKNFVEETRQDNMLTKYQTIKFIDFCEMLFLPESVARVANIVGDDHFHTLRH
ncbi:hypothetical protein TNCV_2184541 [Trichonephila clavipes]|nr:hypothetical protein TNCV_2184541 [Trichonephila clavipes]